MTHPSVEPPLDTRCDVLEHPFWDLLVGNFLPDYTVSIVRKLRYVICCSAPFGLETTAES